MRLKQLSFIGYMFFAVKSEIRYSGGNIASKTGLVYTMPLGMLFIG